jgi:hypothetical protein
MGGPRGFGKIYCINYLSKISVCIVRNRSELRGGLLPFRPKQKRDPPTFRLRPYKVKKITKNIRKRAKIPKNAESRLKVPKIGLSWSHERFLSVFLPYKSKKGSIYTIL